jgi:c(7)-type cytochrome triheme protein
MKAFLLIFVGILGMAGGGFLPETQAADQPGARKAKPAPQAIGPLRPVPGTTMPEEGDADPAAQPGRGDSAPGIANPLKRLEESRKVTRSNAVRPAEASPEQNQYYDPANPDFSRLQKANESLAGFPLDKKGMVDWMKALNDGLIQPRANLPGTATMEVLDLNIILKNTKEMPWVKFPHKSHTLWLACSNCHNDIFIPKAGANEINMTKIFQGQYCGKCHDRVAFITHFSCERCHSVPHGDIKAWWEQ